MAQEDTTAGPTRTAFARRHTRILELLRAYSAEYTYLNRQLASWLGVHTADAAAYAEILYAQDRGQPLTPLLLGRRLAMTSGATTSLLNRLETAGLIVRSRESTDRRTVTLRSDPAIREQAPRFFGPLSIRLDDVMDDYDPEFLDEAATLVERLTASLNDFITHRDHDEHHPPLATGDPGGSPHDEDV